MSPVVFASWLLPPIQPWELLDEAWECEFGGMLGVVLLEVDWALLIGIWGSVPRLSMC
jgi:hypothetical protein